MFQATVFHGKSLTKMKKVASEVGFSTPNAAWDWALAYVRDELGNGWGGCYETQVDPESLKPVRVSVEPEKQCAA